MNKNETLLTVSNPKIEKGLIRGYLTAVLHLSPANKSGHNVCPGSTSGCRAVCLDETGHGGIFKKGETTNPVQQAACARRCGSLRIGRRSLPNW